MSERPKFCCSPDKQNKRDGTVDPMHTRQYPSVLQRLVVDSRNILVQNSLSNPHGSMPYYPQRSSYPLEEFCHKFHIGGSSPDATVSPERGVHPSNQFSLGLLWGFYWIWPYMELIIRNSHGVLAHNSGRTLGSRFCDNHPHNKSSHSSSRSYSQEAA